MQCQLTSCTSIHCINRFFFIIYSKVNVWLNLGEGGVNLCRKYTQECSLLMATPLWHLNVAIGCPVSRCHLWWQLWPSTSCPENLTLCPESAEKFFFSKHAFTERRFIIIVKPLKLVSHFIIMHNFALKKVMTWQGKPEISKV